MKALGAVALAAVAAMVFAQDDAAKKPAAKDRLPFFWKDLDLTEAQKAKYRQLASATEKKKDDLNAEIEKEAVKLKDMKAAYKKLDSGDQFAAAVLTKEQRAKLAALKADSAKRSADKAVKRADKADKKLKDAKAGDKDGAEPKDKKPG